MSCIGIIKHAEYASLPEVTISAFTEVGQEESSIIVPKQRAYTGRKPVISSRLADIPCATLGVEGILDQLNTTLGTSYSLDNPFLHSLLEDCIANNYDFGMAYGHLRQVWYTNDWSTIRDELCGLEEYDREIRRRIIIDNRIIRRAVSPRRVWDLYSNRVVPFWMMDFGPIADGRMWPWPISHAWMDEKDRIDMWTPINGHEWPVPIPKNVNLDLIRIEMLNLGLEYTWLDVLCLRQVGGRGEDMRADEWKLDVPTIGAPYGFGHVVCYLSGLGRPLTLKEGDLDSDRSWFRRAWTLQEIGSDRGRVIAGDTPDGPLHAKAKDGKYATELLTRFHEQLQFVPHMYVLYNALEEMRKRVSTNPVDKVAGLACLLMSDSIPAYYETASIEDAWTALVNTMYTTQLAMLFFLCAEPGDGGAKWRPSWDQVMTKPLLPFDFNEDGVFKFVDRDETGGEYVCESECIVGLVLGLAVVKGHDRHGELIVECQPGRIARFGITASHTYPIPEDTYTLIYGNDCFEDSYAVGRSLPESKFEKVSVLEMPEEEQYRLNDLGIFVRRQYILI